MNHFNEKQGDASVRLFFAAPLNCHAKEALQESSRSWREKLPFASWSHPDDLHVTVKFIGDLRSTLADELLPLVKEAIRGAAPFELTLADLGVFGRKDAPSVLWCGVAGGLDALQSLHEEAESAAAACGIPRENRPFRAHITLARRYRGGDKPFHAQMLNAVEQPSAIVWRVEELVLYRTHFGRRPAYEALAKLPLRGESD